MQTAIIALRDIIIALIQKQMRDHDARDHVARACAIQCCHCIARTSQEL
jgi:hypothetical protein